MNIVGSLDSAYEYISFNFGKYDEATGKNVMDENAKMNDVKLRQAIAYAIDTKTAGESLYNGLYHPAKSLIISFFGDIHDSELEGYSYNPEKAKKLLDEAGYKDVDGDGIREGKDGKAFKITFAARKRTEANEALVQQYIAWWKEVGLNVELYTGRTVEGKSFYNSVQANDPLLICMLVDGQQVTIQTQVVYGDLSRPSICHVSCLMKTLSYWKQLVRQNHLTTRKMLRTIRLGKNMLTNKHLLFQHLNLSQL